MTIQSEDQLREIYGWPKGRAKSKVLNQLETHSIRFIQTSPFLVLSSYDNYGKADASPRGGKPGFVQILDDFTILIPDAKGNNRVDSLINIVQTKNIGLLFFIPGINETLRINGTGIITTDDKYLEHFEINKKKIISCIIVSIQEVFLHCAKAFMRSQLWKDTYKQKRPGFPTIGQMLNDQLGLAKSTETQEELEMRYKKDL